MRKYILGFILALLMGLSGIFNADTMALDSDYKNNLLKVDVVKANDGSYKIDLFTQKPYNEPIKVIKKSDTSYYVFLPETYHSITTVGTSGDINKVDVKLYPYAGQDLNNGYTKIDISTSKPVTFTTSVRTAAKQAPKVDAKKLAQLDSAFDSKPNPSVVQKPVQSQPAAKPTQPQLVVKPVQIQPVVKPVVAPVETIKEQVKEPEKVATATAPTLTQQKTVSEKADKPIEKPINKVKEDTQKIAATAGTEIEIVAKNKNQMQEPKGGTLDVVKKPSPVDLEEVLEDELSKEELLSLEEDAKEQGLTELATGDEEIIPEMSRKQRIKQMVKYVANTVLDNIFLIIGIVLLLVVLGLLLLPKKKGVTGNDVMGSHGYESLGSIVDNVVTHVEATKAEGYPSYEEKPQTPVDAPDMAETYGADSVHVFDETVAESAVAVVEEVKSNEDEADVLASASFGENRGLCLVNYDGSIALIGYIEDEIFVIQNFGKITLLNPSIQIRVAEQNEHDTIYIVKAANSKLMVRETKTLIGLEMVM